MAGTLPYMAPEQLPGAEVDVRSDIWAAGPCFTKWRRGNDRSPDWPDSDRRHSSSAAAITSRSTDGVTGLESNHREVLGERVKEPISSPWRWPLICGG